MITIRLIVFLLLLGTGGRLLGPPDGWPDTTTAMPSPVYVTPTTTTTLASAVRVGVQHQVAATIPPPSTTTTLPVGVAGDCESWRAVFTAAGATPELLGFFIDDGILWRETRCGIDTLNEDTNDSGICQINPIHNRAGWFGGREFGDGGWLGELHDLTAGFDTNSPRWVDACITLFEVCGSGPWQPPYGCANRRLEV